MAYLTIQLTLILVLISVAYVAYNYMYDIFSALDDPGFLVFMRFLMLGIIINFLILTSIVIFHHYGDNYLLKGRIGQKGEKGPVGDPGDEVCRKNQDNQCIT